MTSFTQRPRFYAFFALCAYLICALTYTGIHGLNARAVRQAVCPAYMTSPPVSSGAQQSEVVVLQGNLWLLPARPLLFPYALSTDRKPRLERFVSAVRSCAPDVVVLQEVFDRRILALMERHLPDYHLVTSGRTDPTSTVNASGLVTLSRHPVGPSDFLEFRTPPMGTKPYEAAARKGALAVDISIGGTMLTVLNLHAYSPSNEAERRITRGQIDEAMAMAARLELEGKRVVVAGDFNIDRPDFALALPTGWSLAQHGPTYVPERNPYSVAGANNTPGNHQRRRAGLGSKTVDLLLTAPRSGVRTSSRVVHQLQVSDHDFVHHTISLAQEQ